MSFFDSKQEVLQIELTPFGKHLISKGKFKPKYYAFIDDDIIYDMRYSNISESQNYSQERILNETPYSKQNGNYNSVYDRLQIIGNTENTDHTPQEVNTAYSIGTSDINSEYLPAWNVSFINNFGVLKDFNVLRDTNKSGNIVQDVYNFARTPELTLEECKFTLSKITDQGKINENTKPVFAQQNNEILVIDNNTTKIVADIIEKNVSDLKENFDIEVFKKDGQNNWKQLLFIRPPTNIKNNILLDDYINKESENIDITPDHVDYYFDISIDSEIDLEEVRRAIITSYETNMDKEEEFCKPSK